MAVHTNRIDPVIVRRVLSYNGRTGLFRWRVNLSRKSRKGAIAGGRPKPDGYFYIQIYGVRHPAQIWAWVIKTGAYPITDIDHQNTIRSDNKWKNLRLATRSQNNANGCRPRNNLSGFKGVSWDSRKAKWRAYIVKDGKQHFLGYFDDVLLAAAAYGSAAHRMYGEFGRAA